MLNKSLDTTEMKSLSSPRKLPVIFKEEKSLVLKQSSILFLFVVLNLFWDF